MPSVNWRMPGVDFEQLLQLYEERELHTATEKHSDRSGKKEVGRPGKKYRKTSKRIEAFSSI